MNNNLKYGFTLVELIVVITILAVLATIWFISMTWYATESRDTKRMSDISTINKWLQVYKTRNSLVPEPSETQTAISSGSTNLIVQWYAWESVLAKINVSEVKDPLDNKYYTYSTNTNNTKYQLMALLENDPSAQSRMKNFHTFANYSNRYIYTKWELVWTLLSLENIPVQELWNNLIDLENNSDSYIISFDNNTSSVENNTELYRQIVAKQNNLTGWRALDFNCKIEDITIGSQTWAGCNSTLWNGTEYINETYCYNYDKDWDGSVDNISTSWECWAWNYWNSNDNTLAYFNSLAGNATNSYWDKEYNTIWWKLYTWDSTTMWEIDASWNILSFDDNSICPVWRHIPSDTEWTTLENTLNWSPCRTWNGWQCDGLWWSNHNNKTDINNLANALKLPLTGYRNDDGSTFTNRGRSTALWSSTTNGTSAYYRSLNWDNSTVKRNAYSQNYGFYVRCIQD
jgi:uncharacterized protein (TIGR02145 family)/prepilin-type N-terminal cleavage/methylation domain-containing protein